MSGRLTGRRRQVRNRQILAASDVCHICGHSGADEVDHVTPVARGGSEDSSNLKPAHGIKPCETCGGRCNRTKAARLFPSTVRRSRSLDRPGAA